MLLSLLLLLLRHFERCCTFMSAWRGSVINVKVRELFFGAGHRILIVLMIVVEMLL